jgi:MFS family permease
MQTVLFSWLVVGEAQASPQWVGVLQTSTMLPTIVLLLMGGVTADRYDPRGLLMRLYVIAAVPVLLLAAAVAAGRLPLAGLFAYGLAIGTVSSFTMPARDTLLSRVAGADMMHAVTGTTATQFGAQAFGSLLAGAARWVGTAPMLVVQAALLAFGSVVTSRVPVGPVAAAVSARGSIGADIREGVVEVARSSQLRAALVLAMAVGMLFIGPFLVVYPLLVRDTYHGGVDQLSLVLMMFPLGVIAGSIVLRRAGGLRRKGRAALISLAVAAGTMATVSLGLPFAGLVGTTLLWGLTAAVFINCTRTLFQEAAPPAHRARALSIYQLGFMGMGPVGALLSGTLAARIGALGTLRAFAVGMLVVVAVMALCTATARME